LVRGVGTFFPRNQPHVTVRRVGDQIGIKVYPRRGRSTSTISFRSLGKTSQGRSPTKKVSNLSTRIVLAEMSTLHPLEPRVCRQRR
jgi:hypothetical protein